MEAALEQDATVYQYDEVRAQRSSRLCQRTRTTFPSSHLCAPPPPPPQRSMTKWQRSGSAQIRGLSASMPVAARNARYNRSQSCGRDVFEGLYWNGFSFLLCLFFPLVLSSFQSKYIDSLMKAATDRKKLEDVRLAHKVRRAWCARGLPVWLPCRHYC